MNPVLIGLIIIAAIIAIVYAHIAAQRRREAMFLLAMNLGLQFSSDPGDVHDRYDGFSPFEQGGSQKSRNLLHGRIGDIDWDIFDYQYTTGSGKNRSTHRYGIVAGHLSVHLPRLTLRPEGIFDKIASMAGFDDINFESEQFSRRYHVSSTNRKLAYDLIHPRMIEFLLSVPARHWQIRGTRIVLVDKGTPSVEWIQEAMRLIEQFMALVPDYVRQDRSMTPGAIEQ